MDQSFINKIVSFDYSAKPPANCFKQVDAYNFDNEWNPTKVKFSSQAIFGLFKMAAYVKIIWQFKEYCKKKVKDLKKESKIQEESKLADGSQLNNSFEAQLEQAKQDIKKIEWMNWLRELNLNKLSNKKDISKVLVCMCRLIYLEPKMNEDEAQMCLYQPNFRELLASVKVNEEQKQLVQMLKLAYKDLKEDSNQSSIKGLLAWGDAYVGYFEEKMSKLEEIKASKKKWEIQK